MDETVGFAESGISLPIKIGRVDIPATLQETVAQQANRGRVGFYCGGELSLPLHACAYVSVCMLLRNCMCEHGYLQCIWFADN